MKNSSLLLIITALILTSCGISNEQRKFEINLEMNRLILHMNKSFKQKDALKDQLTQIYIKYDSIQRTAPGTESKTIESKFIKEVEAIGRQQIILEKQDLMDQVKIRKLQQEYAKL